MDAEELHQLTAAYVLDALDGAELERFEEHLAECPSCREEIAELAETVGALAYGAPPVVPPPTLRGRILDAARAERASVTVLRPRWAVPVAAAAAIAACAAIGLGAWDISLHGDLGGRGSALEHVALTGGTGSVLVTPGGSGALVVSDLVRAPAGHTYEAWVIQGHAAAPAGVFAAGTPTTIVALSRPVPAGSRVAVTVEPAGGTSAPTRTPFLVSAPV